MSMPGKELLERFVAVEFIPRLLLVDRELCALLTRLFLLLAACIGMAGVAARPERPRQGSPASHGLVFVDLTSDFDRIWMRTRDLPDNARVRAFESEFARILPGFYSPARFKGAEAAKRYQASVLKGLKAYPAERSGIRRVSRQFEALVRPATVQFETEFGPMRGYPPIYLVDSLGEFDGGTRDLPQGTRLMFGADMIDRIYGDRPIKPLVEHELFHLYHARTFPSCDPVWCNLWEEGLATYVAKTMNPAADDTALGLTLPKPLRPAVDTHFAQAVCAVESRLQSADDKDYAPLFLGREPGLSPDLPPRFGYYVGLLLVEDAGKSRTLKQLAAISPEQAHAIVVRTLAGWAKCGASAHA